MDGKPVFLLAVSDVVWQAGIAGVVAIVLAWMQVITKQAVEKAAVAAAESANVATMKADEVKDSVNRATLVAVQTADIAASKAAVKVEEVKKTLTESTKATDEKLDGLAKVAHDTHLLVNNAMSIQLKLNAVMARRLAGMTKDEGDAKAADIAEHLYAEHERKQALVDSKRQG